MRWPRFLPRFVQRGRLVRASADDEPALVTIPNVEIASTGIEYQLSTGPTTFTERDLADVVGSQDDPAIPSPRLKIGHIDPRFDGEPAVGKVTNLRTADEGQTLVGDFVGVPRWLAEIMPAAYPSRSIEGSFGVQTVTGKRWSLVIDAVALLGVVWPGVGTLEDLPLVYSEDGPDGVQVVHARAANGLRAAVTDKAWDGAASRFDDSQYARACVYDRAKCSDDWKDKPAKQRYSLPVKEPDGTLNRNGVHAAAGRISGVTDGCDAAKTAAAKTLVGYYRNQLKEDPPDSLTSIAGSSSIRATVDVEDVRRTFYDGLGFNESWWWIRAILLDPNTLVVDDGDGNLFRVPFTVNSDGTIDFGDPVPVQVQYVDVSTQSDSTVAGSEPLRARRQVVYASREHSRPDQSPTEQEDTLDAKDIRKRLGLAEDASDEEVLAKLDELSDSQPDEPDKPEADEPEPVAESTDQPADEPEPVAAADGTVRVDGAQLDELKRNAALGAQARQEQIAARRDEIVAAAVKAGKIPPSRRNHYRKLLDIDAEGTEQVLASLEAGVIPVKESGYQGGAPEGELDQTQYPADWLSPGERSRIEAARNGHRNRTTVEA